MKRKRDGLATEVLQSPIISLKTGPNPKTCADNLILSSLSFEVIGLELVCKALTKDRAVFKRNKKRSC